MNPVFEALQRRYQDLIARSGTPSPGDEFWESIRLFLEDARQAGRALTGPRRTGPAAGIYALPGRPAL
jgi:hypothetical protein